VPTQQQIISDCFNPLIAPLGTGEKGKSPGILVGVTYQGTPSYYQFGKVPVMQPGASPATEDIVFFIGSNTKVFTATLLAQAGFIKPQMNIPINGFVFIASLLPKPVPAGQWQDMGIRLWHLATHSAGYPDGLCGEGRIWGNYSFDKTTDFLKAFTPGYEPGRRWHYSNQGFALLGVLLAHAYTGSHPPPDDWDASYHRWPLVVTEQVLTPLGLTSTRVGYNDGDPHKLAQCFAFTLNGAYQKDTTPYVGLDSAGLGAGALTSTLADMMTFLHNQISPPSGNLGAAITLTQQPQGEGDALSMGLGWQIGNGYFEKNGLVVDYASYMAFDPTSTYGIFAMANSLAGDDGGMLCNTARRALGELIGGGTSTLKPPQFPTPPLCLKPNCPTQGT
jgi:CubicO group peptidase (beta-lactamase class C family)